MAPPGRVSEAPRSLSCRLQGRDLSWLLVSAPEPEVPTSFPSQIFIPSGKGPWKGSLLLPANQGLRTTKAGPIPSREPRTLGQSCAFLRARGKYGCLSLRCESVQEETRQVLVGYLAFGIASQTPWMFFPLLSCLASPHG